MPTKSLAEKSGVVISQMSNHGDRTRPALTCAGNAELGEIGYVLMGFPRLSETFITHEIHLLEQL